MALVIFTSLGEEKVESIGVAPATTPVLIVNAITPPLADFTVSSNKTYSEFFRVANRQVVIGKEKDDGISRTLVLYGADSDGRTYFRSDKVGGTMFSKISGIYRDVDSHTEAQTITVVLGRDWLSIIIFSILSGLVTALVLGVTKAIKED